jgi:hypothetical protein
MGLVAGTTTSPCTTSSGLCAAGTAHNDCCALNVMRSFTTFSGTFSPTSRSFSGQPGKSNAVPTCFSGGASSWSQLSSFIGTSP